MFAGEEQQRERRVLQALPAGSKVDPITSAVVKMVGLPPPTAATAGGVSTLSSSATAPPSKSKPTVSVAPYWYMMR